QSRLVWLLHPPPPPPPQSDSRSLHDLDNGATPSVNPLARSVTEAASDARLDAHLTPARFRQLLELMLTVEQQPDEASEDICCCCCCSDNSTVTDCPRLAIQDAVRKNILALARVNLSLATGADWLLSFPSNRPGRRKALLWELLLLLLLPPSASSERRRRRLDRFAAAGLHWLVDDSPAGGDLVCSALPCLRPLLRSLVRLRTGGAEAAPTAAASVVASAASAASEFAPARLLCELLRPSAEQLLSLLRPSEARLLALTVGHLDRPA
ncbi:hypothetical protein BOX15_Mlig000027g2, partial [Macrostomum lignano]